MSEPLVLKIRDLTACRSALIDLVNQITKTNPVDDHGHDLKMNAAYIKAVKLLDIIEAGEL